MKLKVSVIGVGRNGSHFVEAYSRHPDVSEIFIADPYDPLREKYGSLPKVKRTYKYGEEMLAKEDVDLVSIHTPGPIHVQPFVEACRQKRHIFVEKPLATSMADIHTMVEAARGNRGKKMAVGHNYRYEDYNFEIKKLIEDGALGKIICIRLGYITDYFYYWSTEPDNGFVVKPPIMLKMRPILEGGCHHIDLANWFTQSQPKTVHAFSTPVQGDGFAGDWLASIFHYADGSMFHMDASFSVVVPHKYNFGIEIYGTNGSIRDGILYRFANKQYHLREFSEKPLPKKEQAGHSFVEEVEAMVKSIVEDKPVLVTIREGAQAAAGAVAAEEAVKLPGNTVNIPDFSKETI